MYVRVSRFEGGTAAEIEQEIARIQRDLGPAVAGESRGEIPEELARLASRFEMLLDRDRGAVAVLVYAKDEQRIREIDRIMNDMSPTSDEWGRRVSVDLYQVYLDEAPEAAAA